MNLKFTGLGAEPKKLAALGVLVAAGGYFYFSGNDTPAAPQQSARLTAPPREAQPAPLKKLPSRAPRSGRGGRGGDGNLLEFHPSLKPRKEGELDRSKVDPTLRLDLLERLQAISPGAGSRSLFESSQAAAASAAATAIKEPPKIAIKREPFGPPLPPPPAPKPAEPPPPPITLKFYGFISPKISGSGARRAFFLDGDDIIVATEGQLIKNRYRIVRIGVNSAVVEDTQYKNNQQTLQLVEELPG